MLCPNAYPTRRLLPPYNGNKYHFFSFEFNADEWKKWYSHGLDIGSEPPKIIPLTTMQEKAKNLITPFVEKYYPELINSLAL